MTTTNKAASGASMGVPTCRLKALIIVRECACPILASIAAMISRNRLQEVKLNR